MLSDVVPAFVELGKRYTSYSLKLMLSLSSIYAQRMYEIIMMFYGRGQKVFTYEVSKLREALNYPPEHDYFDFKRKALLVAQQEMLQKVNLHFDFTPSKKVGKGVVELRFEVKSAQDLINDDVEADLLLAKTMQPHEVAP
ncbi:RepB family plasmid replication initiator protein [Spirosoma telluris]